MKKYILFDLDGTLTDPKIGITTSVQYALDSFGIHVENPDDLTCFIGPPLLDSFEEYYHFTPEQAQQAVVKFRERFGVKGKFENQVYPGIPQMLEHLQQSGKVLAVATSKLETFAVEILDHFELSQYFTQIVGSLADGSRSEKAEVIAEALKRLSIAPEEAVMVGDRKYDILGAKANGLESVGVRYGFAVSGELEQAGADAIVSTVEELEQQLNQ